MTRSTPTELAQDAGFTLFETLVAFMILALSLTVLSQSLGQATTQIRKSDEVAVARQLAERTMGIARADRSSSRSGADKESELMWNWSRVEVARQDGGGTLLPIYLITVEVGGGSQSAPIATLKYVELAGPVE